MARHLFGTDGIRGKANQDPMTAELALKVAMATAVQFRNGDHRHRVVIGKDTRLSGYLLEPALTAGFISMGMDVVLVGPLPTPAVAMLTRSLRANLGVMISASHNPFEDNGIKLFGPDGYKLCDAVEQAIEERLERPFDGDLAAPSDLGRASRLEDATGRYIESVKSSFPRGQRLEDMKIVVDCAHGAAYRVAPKVLYELGATVISEGVQPDGLNINQGCGATAPDLLKAKVLEQGADIGLALDGDADRLIVVDETGNVIDGDQIMALVAASWVRAGQLTGGAIAATVMSNLGLERFLNDLGIGLIRAPVGDRYVVEAMRANGCNMGGEQSGHIVLSDYATTGDGLVAALQLLSVVQASGRPVSEVSRQFEPVPQLLRNVRYRKEPGAPTPIDHPAVKDAIADGERRLGHGGRLLIRKSGTEPLIRVMAEGDDKSLIESVVGDIVIAVEAVADAPKLAGEAAA